MRHYTALRQLATRLMVAGIVAVSALMSAPSQTLRWIAPAAPYDAYVTLSDATGGKPMVFFYSLQMEHQYWTEDCDVQTVPWSSYVNETPAYGMAVSDVGIVMLGGRFESTYVNAFGWSVRECSAQLMDGYYKYFFRDACNDNATHVYQYPAAISSDAAYFVTHLFKGTNDHPPFCVSRVFRPDEPFTVVADLDFWASGIASVDGKPIVVGRTVYWTYIGKEYFQGRTYDLPGEPYGQAFAITPDGAYIAGVVYNSDQGDGGWKAVIYSGAIGQRYIQYATNALPMNGYVLYGMSISDDGRVVVGWKKDPAHPTLFYPFIWIPQEGIFAHLGELLSSLGLLESDDYIDSAHDIDPTGRYVVGTGARPDGRGGYQTWVYILDTACAQHCGDVNRDRIVDDADLLQVLFAFGSSPGRFDRRDVNCDGVVDDADLLQILFNFGSECR